MKKTLTRVTMITLVVMSISFAGCSGAGAGTGDVDDTVPFPGVTQDVSYESDFGISGLNTPEDYGFEVSNTDLIWSLCLQTNAPGGWGDGLATFTTPFFGSIARDEEPIILEFKVLFLAKGEDDTNVYNGDSFREDNKIYFYLLDEEKNPIYKFMYRPLSRNIFTAEDFQFSKMVWSDAQNTFVEGSIYKQTTRRNVPYGKDAIDGNKWIKVQLKIFPIDLAPEFEPGRVELFYDAADGQGLKQYPLDGMVFQDMDDTCFSFLKFEYKTGTGDRNYQVRIKDLKVIPASLVGGTDPL